ncbi:inositol 5-phosphatase-like protein [Lophiostoma macrostomum CBS 122681]|uniref:Inositol 5-phosphatase-like protein n=1 Tax=Lophiostoma macrostomum CBS 122681 TaxID=1314788 RepID=A0A6A6T235_9PLEO|nr:inositol 5-phosphatase-like protein [Lophiostoma macrostomum CBS 122681]
MLELYLLTFNCARHLVDPKALAPSLFDALPPTASLPDVVAISLQEISPIAYSFLGGSFLTPYFARVNDTVSLAANLRSHGHEQLEHVATRSLGMTALMIFTKPQFAERIRWIQSAGAGVGLWNMGNKGAVAMRLGVACQNDQTLKLTFVAAHLAPMESNIEARNKDWESLARNLVFLNHDKSGYSSSEEEPLLSSSSALPEDGDGLFSTGSHIFFAGDLNYRTHDQPPGPKAYETYPQIAHTNSSMDAFSRLLEGDQLTREKDANRTLHGFEELPITFPPTYKYSVRRSKPGSGHKRSASDPDESWAWAKHRYPSWCDRILFVPAPPSHRLEPQVYTALPVQATSDHRPVALSVRVDEKPLGSHGVDDVRRRPPFPLNSNWKTRRNTARQLEVIVGILSYLALTKKGNAIIVTMAGVAFVSWWIAARFSR